MNGGDWRAERAGRLADERARRLADERARQRAEQQVHQRVEERARERGEALDRQRAEEQARLRAEERARLRAEERARARDHLDLDEGRGPVPLVGDDGMQVLLRETRRIAVVGASSKASRPSFGVFRYLVHQGYECVPVNPMERDVLGIPAFRTIGEAVDATGPFDIVDVFRRSELVVPHAEEAVATGARCLWLQLGVVNWEAARIAHDAGLFVVMDRCTAIEHRRLLRG